MQEITLESIYNLLEKVDVRIDTAEQNISFLMNLKDEKANAGVVIQQPVNPQPKNGVLVNHDGSNYQFNVPKFQLPGEIAVHLAEEAATDPEIIERILKIEGQGIMRLIY